MKRAPLRHLTNIAHNALTFWGLKTCLISFAAVGVFTFVISQSAYAATGVALQRQCVFQARRHPQCRPIMGGIAMGILAGQAMEKDGYQICPPKNLTGQQVYWVVRRFMRVHPEYLNEAAPVLIAHALRDAFACGRYRG